MANINPPGGYNRPHIHPNSHFSGVYYINIQRFWDIVFNDPRSTSHMAMPSRKKVSHQNIYGKFIFSHKLVEL